MIEVIFSEDKRNGKLSLEVKGHAGQAEHGEDIVCSAASILAYTVAQVVINAETVEKLKEAPQIRLNEGDAIIVCTPVSACRDEIFHTYNTAEVGYRLLTHNYPEYVKLTSYVGLI